MGKRIANSSFDSFIYRKVLTYPYTTMSQSRLRELVEVVKTRKITKVDLSQTSIKDSHLPYIYTIKTLPHQPEILLNKDLEPLYNRMVNGGFFEKRLNASKYMKDMLKTSRHTSNNWLVYEDLRESNGIKHIVEILDFGPFLQDSYDFTYQGYIRYRKLKTSLTQPILLFKHLQKNSKSSVWELGQWGWEDITQDYFGLHLPSTPEEDVIIQVLKGILNDEIEFVD